MYSYRELTVVKMACWISQDLGETRVVCGKYIVLLLRSTLEFVSNLGENIIYLYL